LDWLHSYGYEWPPLLLRMYSDGAFAWDAEWPLLLLCADFETFASADEWRARCEDLRSPDDYRKADPAQGFVPFAMSHDGSPYCFYFAAGQAGDVPVVHLPMDSWDGRFLARNLGEFLFSEMVYAAVDPDADNPVAEDPEAVLRTHGPYLTEAQRESVAGLYRGLAAGRRISEQEARALIDQIAPWNRYDEEFRYMGE
jgi:hypothetical protein